MRRVVTPRRMPPVISRFAHALGWQASLGVAMAAALLASLATFAATTAATAATTESSIFGGARPVLAAAADGASVELGVKLRSDVSGAITGVRFYKGYGNKGTHVGSLWSASGTRLAQATFSGETASGWQQVRFARPVAVAAGTTYVASYHTNVGHYAADSWYFSGKGAGSGPLHALASGVAGADGVYRYGGSSFPTSSWRDTNYWVDVLFVASATTTTAPPATTTPPTTTAPAPAAAWPGPSNTGVPAGTSLRAVSGDVTLTTDGQVLDAADVSGKVYVQANNVTIKRSRIQQGIQIRDWDGYRGLVVSDTELGPQTGSGGDDGIAFSSYTCQRCNIHNFSDGGKVNGSVVIQDSWIHDLWQDPGDHNDGLQNYAGSGDVTLRHNTIDGHPGNVSDYGNAAVFSADFPSGTVTIDGNLLSGGQFTLQVLDNATYVVTGNHFVRGSYVYGTHRYTCASCVTTWSGNVFDDNGQAIAM
jgi:Domain of unknown function (DUF4082)